MSSVKNIPKSKLLKKGGSYQDMLAIMTYKSDNAGVKSALCDMLCRKSPYDTFIKAFPTESRLARSGNPSADIYLADFLGKNEAC